MKTVMLFSIDGLRVGETTESAARGWILREGAGYFIQINCKGHLKYYWPIFIKFKDKTPITLRPRLSEISLPRAQLFFTGRVDGRPDLTYVNWCMFIDKLLKYGALPRWAAQGWRDTLESYNTQKIVWR